MKTIKVSALLLCLLICCGKTDAQISSFGSSPGQPYVPYQNTNVASRLTGVCFSYGINSSISWIDSTVYTYSANNGGDMQHILKYSIDSEYSKYINFDEGETDDFYLSKRTFDASNNIIQTLTYKKESTTITTSSGFEAVSENDYTYDNNLLLTDVRQDGIITNATDTVWQPASKTTYSYVGYRLASELTKTLYGDYLYLYTYTYSNGKLISELQQRGDTTNINWVNLCRYNYTYDNTGELTTKLIQGWHSNANQWVDSIRYLDSGFVNNNPQTETEQIWNWNNDSEWIYTNRTVYTYNNYGQVTASKEQKWTGDEWIVEDRNPITNYYYQDYNLAVTPVSNDESSVHIYPIPAQDVLHINIVWDAPQSSDIAICDVQGRVVKQWHVPATKTYSNTIPVNDLASGSYFISVIGGDKRIVQKLVIAR